MQPLIHFFEALCDRELEAAAVAVAEHDRIMRLENAFVFAKLAFDKRVALDTTVILKNQLGSHSSGGVYNTLTHSL